MRRPPNPLYRPEHRALVELLREARERKGLRQVEMAETLNRPQSYVSSYESGRKILDFIEVWDICRAIGIPFSRISSEFERAARRAGQSRRRI